MLLFFVNFSLLRYQANLCHADEKHNHLYNLTLSALGPTLDVRIEF